MIINNNIEPNKGDFTKSNIEAICNSLGGNPETIECLYGKENKLICGDFEVELTYEEFQSIEGCSKYFTIHNGFDTFLQLGSKEKLPFTCVVMRGETEQMRISELDAHLGTQKSAIEFPLALGVYHLSFFQNREKFYVEYETAVHPTNPKITVFAISVVDERHIWHENEYAISSLN